MAVPGVAGKPKATKKLEELGMEEGYNFAFAHEKTLIYDYVQWLPRTYSAYHDRARNIYSGYQATIPRRTQGSLYQKYV